MENEEGGLSTKVTLAQPADAGFLLHLICIREQQQQQPSIDLIRFEDQRQRQNQHQHHDQDQASTKAPKPTHKRPQNTANRLTGTRRQARFLSIASPLELPFPGPLSLPRAGSAEDGMNRRHPGGPARRFGSFLSAWSVPTSPTLSTLSTGRPGSARPTRVVDGGGMVRRGGAWTGPDDGREGREEDAFRSVVAERARVESLTARSSPALPLCVPRGQHRCFSPGLRWRSLRREAGNRKQRAHGQWLIDGAPGRGVYQKLVNPRTGMMMMSIEPNTSSPYLRTIQEYSIAHILSTYCTCAALCALHGLALSSTVRPAANRHRPSRGPYNASSS